MTCATIASRPMPPVPSVLAILVCDSVIVESRTTKASVIGIFDTLHAPEAPFRQRVGFYARMTDAEGDYRFLVRVVYLGDEERIVGGLETETVRAANRLGFMQLSLNLPPLTFPEFGRYEFQLFANDVYVGRATINAVKTEAQ